MTHGDLNLKIKKSFSEKFSEIFFVTLNMTYFFLALGGKYFLITENQVNTPPPSMLP